MISNLPNLANTFATLLMLFIASKPAKAVESTFEGDVDTARACVIALSSNNGEVKWRGQTLKLTSDTLKHLYGETVLKNITEGKGSPKLKPVIKGGFHLIDGVSNFLESRPDILPIWEFAAQVDRGRAMPDSLPPAYSAFD